MELAVLGYSSCGVVWYSTLRVNTKVHSFKLTYYAMASVDQVWSWEYILVVLSVRLLQRRLWLQRPMWKKQSLPHLCVVSGLLELLRSFFAGPFSYFCVHQLLFPCLEALVQSTSPHHAVGRNVLPGLGVDVKCFHVSLTYILVAQLWVVFGSPSRCQLSKENVFWDAAILHVVDLHTYRRIQLCCIVRHHVRHKMIVLERNPYAFALNLVLISILLWCVVFSWRISAFPPPPPPPRPPPQRKRKHPPTCACCHQPPRSQSTGTTNMPAIHTMS